MKHNAYIYDYGVGRNESKFEELYKGSAFTWVGMALANEDDAQEIVDFLDGEGFIVAEKCIGNDVLFYRTSGRDFNVKYGLTGSNAYPDDLTIVSIPNDCLDIMKMLPIQLRFDARWFDDIVDNNLMREGER